jgi:hypothetical protein
VQTIGKKKTEKSAIQKLPENHNRHSMKSLGRGAFFQVESNRCRMRSFLNLRVAKADVSLGEKATRAALRGPCQ